MLTLTLDGQEADLPPDAAVALSFRNSDLRRLDTRETGFSESFALPLSGQNANLLGTPHALSSQTPAPYQRLPAALSANGLPVLSGSAILEASESGYEVTLLQDTADLFNGEDAGKSLRTLDLSAYDHPRALASVTAAATDSPARGYVYALADTGQLLERGDAALVYSDLPASVYAATVLRAIVADALPGYTLTGALLQDERFARLVLPAATAGPRLRAGYVKPYNVQATVAADTVYSMPSAIVGGAGSRVLIQFPVLQLGDDAHFADRAHYSPPGHAVEIRVSGRLLLRNDGTTRKTVQLLTAPNYGPALPPGNLPSGVILENYNSVFSFELTLPAAQLAAGESFYLEFVNLNFNGPATTSITLLAGSTIRYEVSPYALNGAPVHLDASLPDITRADFLKLLANQFNATIAIDQGTRTVRFGLFNELETNRGRAVDWSAKLDHGIRPRLEYRLGDYAQRNLFRYQEAPDEYAPVFGALSPVEAADLIGEGVLPVPDATLPATAVAYEAPVTLPVERDTAAARFRAAWLPLLPPTDPANARPALPYSSTGVYATGDRVVAVGRTWSYQPRNAPYGNNPPGTIGEPGWQAEAIPGEDVAAVALLHPVPAVTINNEAGAAGLVSIGVALTRAGLPFADLLPTYHEGTARVLARVQLLTPFLTLRPADIAGLDFARPVYLSIPWVMGYGQIEGYFYLNLVDQWQPVPGSTRVELLRLGEPIAGLAPAATPLPNYPERALLEERDRKPLRLETGEAILEEPL